MTPVLNTTRVLGLLELALINQPFKLRSFSVEVNQQVTNNQ